MPHRSQQRENDRADRDAPCPEPEGTHPARAEGQRAEDGKQTEGDLRTREGNVAGPYRLAGSNHFGPLPRRTRRADGRHRWWF